MQPDRDPTLVLMISAALEQRDQGKEPDLERLCAERPELIPAVEDALARSGTLSNLQERPLPNPFRDELLAGRYRVQSLVGAGSMGFVYRGHDEDLGRPVAIKIMRPENVASEQAEARFLREAEALAAVRHNAIVTIYDRGRTQSGALFLVMELLLGAPLSDIIQEAREHGGPGQAESLGWLRAEFGAAMTAESSYLRTVVAWMADLAAGLAAAHGQGVFHRDVKPSNVYIQANGAPVLFDFGIAARDAQATRGASVGTPAYMAPEQLKADVEPSPAMDVWGLTATMYHALALQPPYLGMPAQVLAELGRRNPTPAERIHPRLPRDLQAILDRGLARSPSARYPDAQALESDLRAFLDHALVSARYVSPLRRRVAAVWRSSAVRSGLAVTGVLMALAVGNSWREVRAQERSAEGLDSWAQLPPALTLWSPSNRFIDDQELQAEFDALLDRAVALQADPVPALLYRAGFALDHGDPVQAALDMRAVAGRVGTAFAKQLAARYEALPSAASSAFDLDLEELPPPTGVVDQFLDAYHRARTAKSREDFTRVQEQLKSSPELLDYAPAMELLLPLEVSLITSGATEQERVARANEALDLAIRFEERLGRRTAATANAVGGALLGQQRYEEALEPLREGLRLAPSSVGLQGNLGIALRRLERYDEAERVLLQAIAYRPQSLNSYLTLYRVQMALGRFDEAVSTLERAPFDGDLGAKGARMGQVETQRALNLWGLGDHEAARQAAAQALRHFDLSEQNGAAYEGSELFISQHIVDGEPELAFAEVVDYLAKEPTSWARMNDLLEILPDELSPDQVQALRKYLLLVSEKLAPHQGLQENSK